MFYTDIHSDARDVFEFELFVVVATKDPGNKKIPTSLFDVSAVCFLSAN